MYEFASCELLFLLLLLLLFSLIFFIHLINFLSRIASHDIEIAMTIATYALIWSSCNFLSRSFVGCLFLLVFASIKRTEAKWRKCAAFRQFCYRKKIQTEKVLFFARTIALEICDLIFLVLYAYRESYTMHARIHISIIPFLFSFHCLVWLLSIVHRTNMLQTANVIMTHLINLSLSDWSANNVWCMLMSCSFITRICSMHYDIVSAFQHNHFDWFLTQNYNLICSNIFLLEWTVDSVGRARSMRIVLYSQWITS